MKKILFLLAVVSLTFSSFAQMPGGMPGNGKMQAPSIGHIYGKLVDSAGKPLSDVSVLLLQSRFDSASKKTKDVLLKGLTTKANGEFNFEELPVFGKLKLKISATGYKPLEQSVSFKMQMPAGSAAKPAGDMSQGMGAMSAAMNAFDKDLGNIKLATDVKQLQAVTVTASKPTLRMDIDKRVYNVEKDIVNAGGTALDVMKNVPSVNVDIDGNVTLRNSSPQIYVDGRPTTLTLDQIPADAIESVEVITNPSAKYDASGGGAGILNIVLKKNKKSGYNGNLRAGVDKNGGINGGGDFSVRQGKFNITASAMVNQMNGKTRGVTDRLNLTDTPETSIHQTNYDRNKGEFIFARFGIDYFVSNRNTISLTGFKVHGEFKPTSVLDITTDSMYSAGKIADYSERYTNTNRVFNGQGLQFGFKHLFPKQGEEWTVDGNYFQGKNSNNSLYTSDYYTDGPGSNIGSTGLQQIIGYGSDKNFIIQTDYVNPISATLKLETGLRAAMRSRITNNDNYLFNNNTPYLVPGASTDYTNSDNVYAAYVSLTGSLKKFGYKLGLRAESSNYSGELTDLKQSYSNSYPISLFPSIFLSQKLKSNQELQFSVTRRINRPNFFQLIPYTDYSDSLNITRGNPALVPEFTTSYEVSYLKTFKGNNTFLASAYYKRTNNLITRFLDTANNAVSGKQDIINTYVNANYSSTVGAEFTSQNTLTRWLDISTNINIYNSQINTNNVNGTSQDALWSWFGKFNSNFKLPSKFTVQLTAMYQSKTNLPVNSGGGGMGGPPNMQSQSSSQGYIKAFYAVDIAVKRTFLKNDAASVSLSISDIFRTRWSDQYSYSTFFVQEYDRLRDPQMVRLNFSYRFGKMDISLFKRKSQGTGDSGSDMQ
jgi:ferric enterobactin receptor